MFLNQCVSNENVSFNITDTESQAIEVLSILWETLQVDISLLRLAEENNDIEAANVLLKYAVVYVTRVGLA
jgi:hypothetical protein